MPKLFPIPFCITRNLWADGAGKPRTIGRYTFRRLDRKLIHNWGELWIGVRWKRLLEDVDDGRYYGRFSLFFVIVPTLVWQIRFAVTDDRPG